MKKSQRNLLGIILAIIVVIGLAAVTVNSLNSREDGNKAYGALKRLDDSYSAVIVEEDPKSSLRNAQNWYDSIVASENFDDRPQLKNLDNDISQSFEGLISDSGNASGGEIRTLREKVVSMGNYLGIELPFGYGYSHIVILGLSLGLSFLVTVLCRRVIDWDKLREAKRLVEEWDRKIRKARREKKGKKKRKLETKSDEITVNEEKIWIINGKQAVFYLSVFLVFLAWLTYVYSGWTVVWLPFTWFGSGSLSAIGVSLGSFGWFLLSYFGFAQVWREILLPRTDVEEQ